MSRSLGVLFDYNGVIVNDEPLHEAAFARVLSRYNIRLNSTMYQKFCFGRTDREGFEDLQAHFRQELSGQPIDKLIEEKQEEYRRLSPPEDILYPGVTNVIKNLKGCAKLGVVTSGERTKVAEVLKKGAILAAFDFLITAEDIDKGKPDPQCYLKGIQALGLPPSKIVALEDSPAGVQAAKAAGIKCIAVLHTSTRQDLTDADIIVEAIGDINKSLILKILGVHSSGSQTS